MKIEFRQECRLLGKFPAQMPHICRRFTAVLFLAGIYLCNELNTIPMSTEEFARKIKELRNQKKISQEELAEKSGLNLRTIQRIESGESIPRGDSLRKLTSALGVSPDEVMEWDIPEQKAILMEMNLFGIGFLFMPALGILLPAILWISKKDKVRGINQYALEILNFQMTLTLIWYIVHYLVLRGQLFLPWIIFINAYNIILIIINVIRTVRGQECRYYPKIKFLK